MVFGVTLELLIIVLAVVALVKGVEIFKVLKGLAANVRFSMLRKATAFHFVNLFLNIFFKLKKWLKPADWLVYAFFLVLRGQARGWTMLWWLKYVKYGNYKNINQSKSSKSLIFFIYSIQWWQKFYSFWVPKFYAYPLQICVWARQLHLISSDALGTCKNCLTEQKQKISWNC